MRRAILAKVRHQVARATENQKNVALRNGTQPPAANALQQADPHWVLWFSEKIVIGILIGGGRLMQATSFALTTGLIFAYLLVLLLQVLMEPKFRSRKWLRPLGVSGVVAITAWFAFGFVWAPDPLDVHPREITGEYEPGTTLAGIKWIPQYADVRVEFDNQTNSEYRNIDMLIESRFAIVEKAQITNLPGVGTGHSKRTKPAHNYCREWQRG
jgi:hypothetical protein